jgi:hypothetical protein
MALIKWLLVWGAVGYMALLAAMYVWQRHLMYFPDPVRRSPASVGLPQAQEVELEAADGERLIAWFIPPQGDNPIVIYFQGNGGGLDLRAHRFAALSPKGLGFLALNYRGFGGSTGHPTERGILQDADAAYAFVAARVPPARIVLWGESLGTGVAVATAAAHPVARVLLESPYSSTADVAADRFWFVPVRLLMQDQFRSDERIARVTVPVLVLHGGRDRTVPIRFGERLYGLITSPKRFIRLADASHNDHDRFGTLVTVLPFLQDGTL